MNYTTIARAQSIGIKLEQNIEYSIGTCKRHYLLAYKLIEKCRLPKIGDLGNPRPTNKVFAELEENMNAREISTSITQRLTQGTLIEHIVEPTREHHMLISYLASLKTYMKTIIHKTIDYSITLENFPFRRIEMISSYHRIWTAYLQNQGQGGEYISNFIMYCIKCCDNVLLR
jgi:hypothetical protein